jgi:hypothetical protein
MKPLALALGWKNVESISRRCDERSSVEKVEKTERAVPKVGAFRLPK